MKKIVCFGDSNTYGYDARSFFGERLPENERWPEILGALSGWEIINEGVNRGLWNPLTDICRGAVRWIRYG